MNSEYYFNLDLENLQAPKKEKKEKENFCEECGVERIRVETRCICPECGEVKDSLEVLVPEWRSLPQPYKRLSYYKELLAKAQGKILVDIPPELLPKLRAEVLKNYCVWNVVTLRKVLKKLGYSRFFPDSVYIFSLLFPNKKVLRLQEDDEKWLVSGFCKIQGNWCKVKPKGRKTMLSNPYIIRKLSQLRGLTDLERLFSFPKDFKKLIEYEEIWKKFCALFDWSYLSAF